MASIFTRPDSQCWFAAYRAADGRRVKVATKTEDKREAQRIADRLELEAREGRETRKASASLNGVNDAMQRATQLAVSGRLDAHAARDLVNDLLTAAGQETLDAVTNRVWCETWRASKAGSVKDRSRWKYEQVSRDWLTFLNGKGGQGVGSGDEGRCNRLPRPAGERGIGGADGESNHEAASRHLRRSGGARAPWPQSVRGRG